MKDTINQYHKQHYSNYVLAIKETVINNTNSLIEEDLLSFFNKPPLDSMDVIKNKMLSLAKENEIILDSNQLDQFLMEYRTQALGILKEVIKERSTRVLATFVKNNEEEKEYRVSVSTLERITNPLIKLVDTSIRSLILSIVDEKITQIIAMENIEKEKIKNFKISVIQYLKSVYLPNLKTDIKQKFLIRDYILINVIKEQGNRYLFTEKHSRIYQV